jgi:RimJ/RimL family protein N-acetyltransferase
MRPKKAPVGKHFVPIKDEPEAPSVLWDLLEERDPHVNISHQVMPTPEEHLAFVTRHPYRVWYLIRDGDAKVYVGSAYLTRHNEIGVFIFKGFQGRGYGKWAVQELIRRFPGRVYANVAPSNPESQRFFEKLGFLHIQNTLRLGAPVTGMEQLQGRR